MKEGNSFWGFLAGAALGAAVTALFMTGKGRVLVDEASEALSKGLDRLEEKLNEACMDDTFTENPVEDGE